MAKLPFFSLNCNGLRDIKKCQTVLNFFKLKKSNGIVLLQETHTTADLEDRWKEQSGARCFFSHGDSNSKGVATLIYNSNIEIVDAKPDPNGRYLLLNIKYEETSIILVNIYAPTKDKTLEQLQFFEILGEILNEYMDQNIVIGGDANTLINPELDKTGCVTGITQAGLYLRGILEHLDMVDIWRARNPEKRKYTWRGKTKRGVIQSRIDYFFISSSLANLVTEIDIVPGICSDHSLIVMSNEIGNITRRGKGFWKFNSSLLKDSAYVDKIKKCIMETRRDNADLEDKNLLWDLIKCNIRGITQSHSMGKHRLERKREESIKREIIEKERALTEGDEQVFDELAQLKQEYDNIQADKAEGAIIRAKVNWSEYGEKNSKLFLQLEKQQQAAKHIKALITDTGVITDPRGILAEEERFYSELYTESISDRESSLRECPFLHETDITYVSEQVALSCDKAISLEECKKALYEMSSNKSPGSDGFTVEFFRFFWDDIGTLLLDGYNYSFQTKQLSIEQRRGVITLIPKKDKDTRLLKNWRPITLLNTDYKILTKVLASRLQAALKDIISEDQTGYIQGRYIGENIRVIDDIITQTAYKSAPGYIILLDFEKAFDRLSIDFLKEALKAFKFGPNFRSWVGIIYQNISSCVVNNGYASRFFPITRGIRQGCPISAMLFIIVVELLSLYLKNHNLLKGITVNGINFTISQLADDTTLFLQDIDSIRTAFYILHRFYESSGLRLNKNKCEIFILGNCGQANNPPNKIEGVTCTKDSFKALGIWFCRSERDTDKMNFFDKIRNVQITLNVWLQRQLSLKGKITVLKSLVIPKLMFCCSNMFVPKEFIEEVQKLTFKFLWGYKPAKIKKETVTADIQQGGLKMPLFSVVVESAKVIWIKRLLEAHSQNKKWANLALMIPNMSEFDLLCKRDPSCIKISSRFHKQIMEAWFKFHSKEPKCVEEIKQEFTKLGGQ